VTYGSNKLLYALSADIFEGDLCLSLGPT